MVQWVFRSIAKGGYDELFFFKLLHKWCNKDHGMSYPVCGMVHIKEPLLLIRKRAHEVATAGLLFHYLSGPLPYA